MRPFGALGVVVVMVAVASCQDPCSASTCDGCCDDTGACLAGVSRLACGSGASTCAVCSGTDACVSHACGPAPAVDAGVGDGGLTCHCGTSCCLPDGSCSPGNLPEACGANSHFCSVCGVGERCQAASCVPATCSGCLDAVGTCVPGSQADACGSGGALCVACLTSETCFGGACTNATCSPANCAGGCCLNGQCVTSNASHCGLLGGSCSVCTTAQSCTTGRCL